MKEKGSLNSEARRRKQEGQKGYREPRLLTENHPVYVGQMIPEIYEHIKKVRKMGLK